MNKITHFLIYFFNYLVLGRYKVVIRTPQFLGNQEKFYMFEQTGWLYITTLKFKPISNLKGNHIVYFKSLEDAHSAVIKWL